MWDAPVVGTYNFRQSSGLNILYPDPNPTKNQAVLQKIRKRCYLHTRLIYGIWCFVFWLELNFNYMLSFFHY